MTLKESTVFADTVIVWPLVTVCADPVAELMTFNVALEYGMFCKMFRPPLVTKAIVGTEEPKGSLSINMFVEARLAAEVPLTEIWLIVFCTADEDVVLVLIELTGIVVTEPSEAKIYASCAATSGVPLLLAPVALCTSKPVIVLPFTYSMFGELVSGNK